MEKQMEKMTVMRIEPFLHKKLRIAAIKRGLNFYELANKIITDWLDQNEQFSILRPEAINRKK